MTEDKSRQFVRLLVPASDENVVAVAGLNLSDRFPLATLGRQVLIE